MNYVDLIVLGIVGVSALLGLSRGLVREVLGIGAWALAAFGAWRLGPLGIRLAHLLIANDDIAETAAYASVFLILLITLSLLSNLLGRLVQVSALGGLDRTLGVLFGIARGSALVIAGYIVWGLAQPKVDAWPLAVQQARTVPLIYAGASWLADRLPERYRPRLQAPPQGRPTNSEDLLHVTPEGRALGPRPTRT